jgi:putative SOS response-associated peptidase YedK
MCGRFSLGASGLILADLFGLPEALAWTSRYNIAPTQEALTVVKMRDALERQARLLRWGLVPPWAEGPAVGSRMINARAETVATKPAFRRAFKGRRCLVLADGFYEWQKQDGRKQPYNVRLHEGHPFAFAGLWERWAPPDRQPLDSCAIPTTVANDLILPLHVRMPVILQSGERGLLRESRMIGKSRASSIRKASNSGGP